VVVQGRPFAARSMVDCSIVPLTALLRAGIRATCRAVRLATLPSKVPAVVLRSISWQIWPIPIAVGLTNLSYTMLTFDDQWQARVVGSREGDATVTLSSQLALGDRQYLLEDPSLYSYRRVKTTHGAEPGNAEVHQRTKEFFLPGNPRGAHAAYTKLHNP